MRGKKIIKWSTIIIILTVLLIISALISLTFGSVDIPPDVVFKIILNRIFNIENNYSKNWHIIVWDLRLPGMLMAILVGMALAVAGATMQGLFRNPLADPFIIGISSGGAFGAIIGLIIRINLFPKVPEHYFLPIFSFVGAIGTIFLVYALSKKGGKVSVTTMLLVGIALSSFFSAITLFFTYIQIGDPRSVLFWMLGSLDNVRWFNVNVSTPLVIIGLIVLIIFSRDLNAFSLGEDTAKQLGINVERVKLILLSTAALITAIAVAFAGIIGFVGLIIPHIMRKLVGPDHRILIPASALFGGIFLIWANVLSLNFAEFLHGISGQQIELTILPVGVVTAMFGAPFFLYLLLSKK
jgi:iron complex transport system permease protein